MLHFDLRHNSPFSIQYRVVPRPRDWTPWTGSSTEGHVYCLVSPRSIATWRNERDNFDTANFANLVFRQPTSTCDYCSARHTTLTMQERFLNSFEFTLAKPCFGEGFPIPMGDSHMSQLVLPHGAHYDLFQRHVRPYLTSEIRVWTVPTVGAIWHTNRFYLPKTVRNKCSQYGSHSARACGARRMVSQMLFRTERAYLYPSQRPYHDLLEVTDLCDIEWIIESVMHYLVGNQEDIIRPAAVYQALLRNSRMTRSKLRAKAILTGSYEH